MDIPSIPRDCSSEDPAFDALKKAVQAGLDDLENGRSVPWDPAAVKESGRQRFASIKAEGK